jgi:hypothetical protein
MQQYLCNFLSTKFDLWVIVRYITLYSDYDRLQLLLGKALTVPELTDKTNKIFEPKSSVGMETLHSLPVPWNESLCG